MIHVRHAAAAIAAGLCETVLITHGESSRSGVGRIRNVVAPTSLARQFEQLTGTADFVHDPHAALHEDLWQLAMVSVVRREWAAKNPRVIPGRPALAGRPGDADHGRGWALWACVLRDAPSGHSSA